MDGYKHFIRVNAENIVIDGYADWQTDKRNPDEIPLNGEQGRHFQIPLTNERGQYRYKVVNGAMVERTQAELDAEWAARPPAPKSEIELLKEENAQQNLSIIDLFEAVIPLIP